VNVGGRKILMSDLKSLYEGLGFKEVITYIQSGNVIFEADKSSGETLEKKIEKRISETFNMTVPVIIRHVEEIQNVLSINPFLKNKGIDIEKLHVTFLEKTAGEIELDNIKKYDYSPDKYIIIGREVFLYCPGGYGYSKLSNNFFENKLKVHATTRNWKTVNKLLELSSGK
jgi:uncharacterized protein (DUF1697 family)